MEYIVPESKFNCQLLLVVEQIQIQPLYFKNLRGTSESVRAEQMRTRIIVLGEFQASCWQ